MGTKKPRKREGLVYFQATVSPLDLGVEQVFIRYLGQTANVLRAVGQVEILDRAWIEGHVTIRMAGR